MKRYLHPLFVTALFLFFLSSVYAQTDREFWFVAPEVTTAHYDNKTYPELGNVVYRGGEPVFLRFTSLEKPTTVTITQPANPAFDTITFSMPANSNESINLTNLGLQAQIENTWGVNGFNNKGIHIESTNLITAYYEVYTTNNTDLFALKGENSLGTEFYVPMQTKSPNHVFPTVPAYHQINIVATADGTNVWITPTDNVHNGHPANVQYMITLDKGETYQIAAQNFSVAANDNLSGTHVVSNYPIAITISDDSAQYPGEGCYDLGGDQIIPIDVIGNEYIAMKGMLGSGGKVVRDQLYIVGTEDNTDVFVNGVFLGMINKGQTISYIFKNTDYAVHVETDPLEPVYVLHVSGFGCEMGQAILPPTSACTGSTRVGFTRSNDYPCYLNVMVRKDAFDGFTLNGKPILRKLSDWTVPPGDNTWLAAIVNLDTLTVTKIKGLDYGLLANSKDIFHMGIFNGNTTGGCRFGYFSDFHKLKVDAITAETGTGFYRVCYGEEVEMEAQGGTEFYWTPEDFLDDPHSQYPKVTPRYTTKYTVHVSGACDMVDSAEVTIQLLDKVEAIFTLDTTQACAPFEFTLNNSSTGVDDEYKWDFGDGSPISNASTAKIKHIFENKTDTIETYNITLVTKNLSSCRDTLKRSVRLFPEVAASFTQSALEGCQPLVVDFNNTSTGAQPPTPYKWEFGDAGSSTQMSPSHSYNIPDITQDTTFDVQLIIANSFYCYDTAYSSVTIHPFIDANFSFAPTFSCNPYNMSISNSSVGVDTYTWSFGDGTPDSDTAALNFEHLYDNTTPTKQVYNIELRASNDQGCLDSVKKIVTVYPGISASFSVNTDNGCDSLPIVFTNNSFGAFINNWDFGDGSSSTEINPTHVYRNKGKNDTIYTVRLIVGTENMFCSDTFLLPITVHPYIKAGYTIKKSSGCTPYTLEITNSSAEVDVYDWDFGDGNSSITNAVNFTHQYVNNTGVKQTYPLKLIVSNNQGCQDSITRNVTVYPSIGANFIMDRSESCYGDTIVFTNLSVGAQLYEWTFGDASSSSEFEPLHFFDYKGTVDTVYNIRLRALSDSLSTCTSQFTLPLTVHPYLKANFSINKQGDCTPFNLSITNSSVGASSRTWYFGDGNTSTSPGPNLTHTYTNAGATVLEFNLKLVVNSSLGCTDSLVRKVSVYPEVTAQFTTSSGCEPHYIGNFNNTSSNATIWDWDFGDGTSSNQQSPVHTFRNFNSAVDTTITVSLEASSIYGCSDTYTSPVTVYASPKADFDIQNTSNCPPYIINITNVAQGHDSLSWNYGNGTFDSRLDPAFTVTYLNATTNIVTYPVTQIAVNKVNGCSDTIVSNFIAYPAPTANFSIGSGCSPYLISDFNNTSTGAVSWIWDMGDGTSRSTQHPVKTFNNTSYLNDTSYIVTLTVASFTGCTAVHKDTTTVYHKPDANFDIGNVTGCSPYIAPITNNCQGVSTLDWDFGDGTTSNTTNALFTHDYFNTTGANIFYPITVIATTNNLCRDTVTHNALIYPDIEAHFSVFSGCDSLLISDFMNASVGKIDSYDWDFGDNTSSNLQSPSHYFRNYGNDVDSVYTVTLRVENLNGCNDEHSETVTVYARPLAQFTILNVPGCSPHPVVINNTSVGDDSMTWDFGDGSPVSTSQNPSIVHTYTNLNSSITSYPVTLIASTNNGCKDTLVSNAPIYPQVIVDFSITSGCDPLFVNNFNNATINAQLFSWNFGDGESTDLENPTHTFRNYSRQVDSVYKITLYAESIYGCNDTLDTLITVYHKPMAEFSILNSPICAPDSIRILNNSVGMNTCSWNFDDGQTATTTTEKNLAHYYENNAATLDISTISLVVSTNDGCTHSVSRNATVYPIVNAEFDSNLEGCAPLSVTYINQSVGGYSYNWSFGDGNTSSQFSPVNVFQNYSNLVDSVQTTRLTVTSQYGCTDFKDTVITAYPNPRADFTVLNSPACSPVDIQIQSASIGASSIFYDFGDTKTELHSNNLLFTHHYENHGVNYIAFPITQTVRNWRGCSDVITRDATVFPDITSEFVVNLGGCNPLTIRTQNLSIGAVQNIWKFGDGNGSSARNPEHTYYNYSNTVIDTFNISLETVNNHGCKAFSDTVVVIYPNPKSDFEIEKSDGCSPFMVHLTNISEGASEYEWTFGDGTVSQTTNSDFYHTYINDTSLNPVNTTIKLLVRNPQGCADTLYKIINIYPEVTADFTGNFEGCSPLLVNFNDASLLAHRYEWDFGDGEVSSVKNPNHYYVNKNADDATYTVRITAYSVYECSNSRTHLVTAYPTPDADFVASPTIQVFPSSAVGSAQVICTDLTTPQSNWNYEWDYGDGQTSAQIGDVSHDYTQWNENEDWYTIRLITTSEHDCADTAYNKIRINSPLPEAKFSMFPIEGCPPLTVQFSNESSYESSVQWEIKEGDKLIQVFYTEKPSYTFYESGIHDIVLTVTGDGGSTSIDTTVSVFIVPTAKFDFSPQVVNLPNGELNLQNLSYPIDTIETYEWSIYQYNKDSVKEVLMEIEEQDPQNVILDSRFLGENYIQLVVTTEDGCVDTVIADQVVEVKAPCDITFPNAFTPIESTKKEGNVVFATNYEDGLLFRANNASNDLFFAQVCEPGIVEYHLEIYNRWGEMIFASDDRNEGWNGYYRNEQTKMDVYVWKFTGTCDDGNKIEKVGDVTLIR